MSIALQILWNNDVFKPNLLLLLFLNRFIGWTTLSLGGWLITLWKDLFSNNQIVAEIICIWLIFIGEIKDINFCFAIAIFCFYNFEFIIFNFSFQISWIEHQYFAKYVIISIIMFSCILIEAFLEEFIFFNDSNFLSLAKLAMEEE